MLLVIASCHGKYALDSILANSQLGVALDPKLGKSNNDINSEMTFYTLETTILCLCVAHRQPMRLTTESVTTANTASKQQQFGFQKMGVS